LAPSPRLVQRIPVRVQIGNALADIQLVIGMTATVETEAKPKGAPHIAPASVGKTIGP
jgi:hypothetical protein